MNPSLGKCMHDNTCTCQRFLSKEDEPLICLYCNHYDGYHEEVNNNTNNISVATISNLSRSTSNKYKTPKKEILINFQLYNKKSNSSKCAYSKYSTPRDEVLCN